MELLKNLRWMCRVCAVNIKKRRSAFSAKPIFGTPQLIEKLRKYLDMDLEVDDDLPKSICGNCFKRLESVHNFALLAKKTENFLKDFINIAQNQAKGAEQSTELSAHFQNEFASFALLNNDSVFIVDEPSQHLTAVQKDSSTAQSQPRDVVLNCTMNNPLTKNIQSKLLRSIPSSEMNIKRNYKKSHANKSNYSSSTSLLTSSNNSTNLSLQKSISNNNLNVEQKNNLEQKRRNLKMILVNNNAQATSIGSPSISTQQHQQRPQSLSPIGSSQIHASPTNSNNNSYLSQQQIQHQQQQAANFQQRIRKESVIYDCLNLGCVIKDMDLLKLILKALKWSYTNETLSAQIQRLRNTRFRDVMIDPNLLQDTDLMQILSTYLSPILLQTQNVMPAAMLPTVVSYKIPADTSVHLVTVPSDEISTIATTTTSTNSIKNPQTTRKYRRMKPLIKRPKLMKSKSNLERQIQCNSPIEILSDDSGEIQMFEVSIDPTLYFPQDSEIQDSSNESLVISLVNNKQNNKDKSENQANRVRRKQKRKEAHIKLHTDKESVAQIVVEEKKLATDKNASGFTKPTIMNAKDSVVDCKKRKIEKDSTASSCSKKLNDASIVPIINENLEDDLWKDFKVTASPTDYSGIDHLKDKIKKELVTEPDEGSINQTEIQEPVKNEIPVEKDEEEKEKIEVMNETSQSQAEEEEEEEEEEAEVVSSSTNTSIQIKKFRKKQETVISKKEVSSSKDDEPMRKKKQSSSWLRSSKHKEKGSTNAGTRQSKRKISLSVDSQKDATRTRRERKSKLCSKYYVHPTERTSKSRNSFR